MTEIDQNKKHFFYMTGNGRMTACGVCLRHICTENIEDVNCERCLRLIRETDLLKMIEDL